MKKLLVVLVSLGLIVAFSTAASAVDVKFNGEYYLTGAYESNPTLVSDGGYSRATWYQRARLQTVFVVAEGLSMTFRIDALEKNWGQTDSRSMTVADVDKTNSRVYSTTLTNPNAAGNGNIGGKSIQENMEFERAYITFATKIGQFDVGYQNADAWGTVFGNSTASRPRIMFTTKFGSFTLLGVYEKIFESDSSRVVGFNNNQVAQSAFFNGGKADADADAYYLGGVFNFKGGEAGLLYKYLVDSRPRVLVPTVASPLSGNYGVKGMAFIPYFKTTIGPVYLEGEAVYGFGKMKFDAPTVAGVAPADIDLSNWQAYLKGQVNIGPAYVGGQIAYIQGDGDSADKKTSAFSNGGGGYDWSPALILLNVNNATYMPYTGSPALQSDKDYYKESAYGYFIYNGFVGFNPTPKLNTELSVSVVKYDTKKAWNAARTAQTELNSDKIGTEIDWTATYKIYDNLSYMVGAGYLITGDAWKGTTAAPILNDVGNDYMLMNKLTLSF
jgi:hypothetical protein